MRAIPAVAAVCCAGTSGPAPHRRVNQALPSNLPPRRVRNGAPRNARCESPGCAETGGEVPVIPGEYSSAVVAVRRDNHGGGEQSGFDCRTDTFAALRGSQPCGVSDQHHAIIYASAFAMPVKQIRHAPCSVPERHPVCAAAA